MHWADFTARKLSERGFSQISASGITPSGEFHIGHLREILTAEMIHRSCLDAGMESRYIFIVDSMDPLRRVYDFLSPNYESFIGHPLAFIPAPDPEGNPGDGDLSYADYFLQPFLDSLGQIGVFPEVVMNHQTYEDGSFAESIDETIRKRDEIREIIERISGRELSDEWFPYNPLGSDGSMDEVLVTGYEWPFVNWVDRLGSEGSADIRKAQGKLPWRIDWAARWGIHGITCEPAGKDHGASGGSYDTGIPISRLLGGEPPDKMTYEWIQLKGMGPMSSSSGVTIGPMEALDLVPPEILRYIIARSKTGRHIEFDTGSSLFKTADEFERLVANPPKKTPGMSKRQEIAMETQLGSLRMSKLSRDHDLSESIGGVSFSHLSMLAQIKSLDDDVWDSLRRSEHISGKPSAALVGRLSRMRSWISSEHFPEESRLEIGSNIPDYVIEEMSFGAKEFFSKLIGSLTDNDWEEDVISSCIREAANSAEINLREAYSSLYWALIGKGEGPKASAIIAEMKKEDFLVLIDIGE